MQTLIADDFIPQDRVEIASFEINPQPVDIDLIINRVPPQTLQPVVVPPAPPSIDIETADRPAESLTTQTRFTLPEPDIDLKLLKGPTIIDRDPQPIIRILPTVPQRATRSGQCLIGFNIGPDGSPFDVKALSCSQSLFERAAVTAVRRWTYRPKIVDGRAVTREGMRTRIVFQVKDEAGRVIPE